MRIRHFAAPLHCEGAGTWDVRARLTNEDLLLSEEIEKRARVLFESPDRLVAEPAAFALSALLSEGCCLIEEAVAFALAAPSAFQAAGTEYVEYLGLHGRRRLVEISFATSHLLRCGVTCPSKDQVLRSLISWTRGIPHEAFQENDQQALANLERAISAYWARQTPGSLLLDNLGVIYITPVERAALARLDSRLPLVKSTTCTVVTTKDFSLIESDLDEALGTIQSIEAILTETPKGQLAAFRREQRRRLSLLEAVADSTREGQLAFFYATCLLSIGTVKVASPSASITARYFREIANLLRHFGSEVADAAEADPGERRRMYDKWREKAIDVRDQSAAVSALDMYFVIAHDAQPADAGDADWEPFAQVRPSVLWPHEVADLRGEIDRRAPTPTIKLAARAVLSLFLSAPMRPSHLASSLFEDLDDDLPTLHFVVRRRAGRSRLKTEAAGGPVRISDPQSRSDLIAFKNHRLDGVDGDPLWAATRKEAARILREACSLLNSCIKSRTGDPGSSLYALRHTVFSEAVAEALAPGVAIRDPRRLAHVADGNHAHVGTTITNYFHMPMRSLREHADVSIERLLTPKGAALWAGVPPATFYKRLDRLRAKSADLPHVRAITMYRKASSLPSACKEHPCDTPDHQSARGRVRLADVLQTIFEQEERHHLYDAHCQWQSMIAKERLALRCQHPDPVARHHAEKREAVSIARYIERHWSSRLVQDALNEWTQRTRGGLIDVSSLASMDLWLRFLAACRFQFCRIVIRLVDPTEQDVADVQHHVISALGARVALERVKGGYNRPRRYLLISSKDLVAGASASSAALSMSGLNAVFVAAVILRRVRKEGEEGTGND